MPPTNITNLPLLSWVADCEHGLISECSAELLKAYGGGETAIIGAPIEKLIGTHAATVVKNWCAESTQADAPLRLKTSLFRQNGAEYRVELYVTHMETARPLQILCVAFAAITTPVQIEAAVSDQSKLDTLAFVAEGMGHEINNPLQIIVGHAEFLLTLARDETLRSGLSEILAAANRIQAAVANLQNFARPEIR
ncbi:MAG: hypothetical protein KF713_04725 [Turneriella sp.]|nr:hypothetical protein [Turneriella sp.]